jgi:S1-C subfamily serine protease
LPPSPPQPEQPRQTRKSRRNRYFAAAAIAIIACSLFAGVFAYYIGDMNSQSKLSSLQKQITTLQNQLASLSSTSANNGGSTQVVPENVSLSTLYDQAKASVVVITDTQSGSLVEGSGFINDLSGRMIIVTNNHVISGGTGISVTFSDGDGYAGTVLGADPYADLAVLSTDAPSTEYHPLQIVNSSTLSVGDFVAAIGSPFGLAGSMTTGIVSALGRTITESTSDYAIADVIQFSAPINPGNSGGPLLNAEGEVVGINTAGIENSQNGGTAQGVGFAISSQTILREVTSLVDNGSYTKYPYMGIGVVDNSYDIASQEGLKVTYGVLVEQVVSGGPADKAGIKAGTNTVTIDGESITVGGDVIIAINGARIINEDALSTYLAENTLPGQTISVTVLRGSQTENISLVLGTRPAPS